MRGVEERCDHAFAADNTCLYLRNPSEGACEAWRVSLMARAGLIHVSEGTRHFIASQQQPVSKSRRKCIEKSTRGGCEVTIVSVFARHQGAMPPIPPPAYAKHELTFGSVSRRELATVGPQTDFQSLSRRLS